MSQQNSTLLGNGHVVAARINKSHKTFLNIRSGLYALGFPLPVDIPGDPSWVLADVDAWILSRRQAPQQPQAAGSDSAALHVQPTQPVRRGRGRPTNAERSRRAAAQQAGVQQ